MDTPLEVPNVPAGGKEPPKYVRTFGSDMETLQQGGTPDLAPLPASRATPLERIVAPSPISEEPAAVPGEVVPPQKTPLYTPPPPAEAPIKTYGGDFIDRVKETKASAATMLAAEQDAASEAPAPLPENPGEKRSNILFTIGGIALLVLGGGGAAYAYLMYASTHAPVVTVAPLPTPIFVDEREEISGSPAGLIGAIAKSAERPITTGSIRLLSASTTVFTALPLSAPGLLTRNIAQTGSMAGIVSVSGTQSPFFILSVTSYRDTFAGMLSWETNMPRDLAPIFPAYAAANPAPPIAATSTATTTASAASTTPASPAVSGAPSFHDEVAANHDVRVYRDAAGRSRFLYGYWNQTTLIIARDPAAFAEIVGRLATSRSR